tara:strand:+ start:157 stop:1284 length:1128 start_codon:yes stop_codon:yes gene_type:complete
MLKNISKINALNKLQKIYDIDRNMKIKLILYTILIIIIISTSLYIYHKVRLNKLNCNVLKKVYNSKPKLTSISSSDLCTHALRDFYVKTAYNCCCSGQFKNDYVNLCALTTCIEQGARCLDFEIYSINNKPVVAASSIDDYTVKETYNSISISDVFTVIENIAFSSSVPAYQDPLLLHFRIMSDNVSMYDELANIISTQLNNRTLGKEYLYEYQGKNLGIVPISQFKGKIIIMIDGTNPIYKKTKLLEYINITSGSPFMHILNFQNVKYTQDLTLTDFNKKHMSIVIPNLNTNDVNPNFNIARQYGCQFLAMSFQNYDTNLEYYNTFFDKQKSAFVLKPAKLRYIPVTIKQPNPPPPEYSYETRNIKSDYYNYNI